MRLLLRDVFERFIDNSANCTEAESIRNVHVAMTIRVKLVGRAVQHPHGGLHNKWTMWVLLRNHANQSNGTTTNSIIDVFRRVAVVFLSGARIHAVHRATKMTLRVVRDAKKILENFPRRSGTATGLELAERFHVWFVPERKLRPPWLRTMQNWCGDGRAGGLSSLRKQQKMQRITFSLEG